MVQGWFGAEFNPEAKSIICHPAKANSSGFLNSSRNDFAGTSGKNMSLK